MDCVTTACHGLECATNDTKCYSDAYKYGVCHSGDKSCKNWDAFVNKSVSDAKLPADYYTCDKDCRPKNTSYYFNIYMCQAKCGGITKM